MNRAVWCRCGITPGELLKLLFAGEAERHRGDPGDAEMAVEALEASCIITPSEEESSKGLWASAKQKYNLSWQKHFSLTKRG